jgi:hypothetical protein
VLAYSITVAGRRRSGEGMAKGLHSAFVMNVCNHNVDGIM